MQQVQSCTLHNHPLCRRKCKQHYQSPTLKHYSILLNFTCVLKCNVNIVHVKAFCIFTMFLMKLFKFSRSDEGGCVCVFILIYKAFKGRDGSTKSSEDIVVGRHFMVCGTERLGESGEGDLLGRRSKTATCHFGKLHVFSFCRRVV